VKTGMDGLAPAHALDVAMARVENSPDYRAYRNGKKLHSRYMTCCMHLDFVLTKGVAWRN
jgi:hypothetical protein